ncbi:hypothetical protein BLNAU_7423 [Blattamonas nauphoetae]|uniref:Uncharacterized protein n=1 Tax=Blattamonas nauphoetae TaxID=2049346 RepID=A0ABQ9Y1B6_9EUKA|nr:hypothetical protein BLNAU_7423 [Blattamonas nauphoetae]
MTACKQPPFPDTVGKDCRRVIRKLLEKDTKKRMTIEQLKTDPWLTSNGSFVFPTPYRVEVSEEEMDNAVTAFKPLQAMIGLKIMMSRKANEARQRVRDNSEAMTARTSATAQTSLTETDSEENKREANEDGSGTLELGLVEDEKLVRAGQSNQPSVEQQSDISTNMVSQTGHESANRESPTPSVAESWSVPLSPHLPHKTSQIGESYALPLNEMESTRRAEEERMKKDREEAQLRAKKMMDKSDECCFFVWDSMFGTESGQEMRNQRQRREKNDEVRNTIKTRNAKYCTASACCRVEVLRVESDCTGSLHIINVMAEYPGCRRWRNIKRICAFVFQRPQSRIMCCIHRPSTNPFLNINPSLFKNKMNSCLNSVGSQNVVY